MPRSKKKATKAAKATKAKKKQQKQVTEGLLQQAETAYSSASFQDCINFCDRVLSRDARSTEAMETKALALIQIEQPDEARALLEESIRLQPDQGASKYLYLGQMSFGEDAAQALGKGIELLAVELDEISQMSTQEDIQELQDQIAAAFCSLAEVYLTDLCEIENAQDTCLALMEKALEYDVNNLQALQTLASIQISLSNPEKAKEYLFRSLDQWWGYMKHSQNQRNSNQDSDSQKQMDESDDKHMTASYTVHEDDNDADNDDLILDKSSDKSDDVDDDLQYLPPYEARINAAKMLIELEEYALALELLDLLISEDDAIMQVWYLQGWTLHLMNDMDAARESLTRARETYIAEEADRPEVYQHIEELLASIAAL